MTLERGDVAKMIISALLLFFFVFVCTQIYVYHGKAKEAQAAYNSEASRLVEAQADHENLKKEYSYYLNPVNLEKELKARFNYHEAGEKTLILVPQGAQTSD